MPPSFISRLPFASNSQQSKPPITASPHRLTPHQRAGIGQAALESHIGSVLVVTEAGEILYATESLQSRLDELTNADSDGAFVSSEVAVICQFLRQCRDRFPDQNWAIDFDIFTKDAITLRIRSRWIKLDGIDKPCILLIVEDRQQLVKDMVLTEAEDWGLTAREQEVWLLAQAGYSHKQIADQLYIGVNTVKKHMRSIHAKRRAQMTSESAPAARPLTLKSLLRQ